MPEDEENTRGGRRKEAAASAGKELVAGSSAAAAAIGATGLLGPFGALLGPAVSVGVRRLLERFGVDRIFTETAEDLALRSLGPRQLERVTLAYRTAGEQIAKRLDEGGGLRNDGFFAPASMEADEPPPAREVLERILEAASEAFERRKAERLGELYGFFAFRADIAPGHAHRLAELVRRLTYRQLLWLGALNASGERRDQLPDWTTSGAFTVREMGVVGELLELAALGLVLRADRAPIATYADINPRLLVTSLEGKLFVEAMELERAEPDDWDEITDALRRLGTLDPNDGSTHVDAVGLPGDPPDRRVRIDYRTVSFTPAPARHEDET